MRIAIIDNYDSFTYNLVHLLESLGAEVQVCKNDCADPSQLGGFDKLLLSPGPGLPSESGLLPDIIRAWAGRKPMLGVCLGHQAIAEAYGGRLEQLATVFHGIATPCEPTGGDPLFEGLPRSFDVGRYHSWVVSLSGFPACLEVTATAADGAIMALRHRSLPIHGIQFHPESILTPLGPAIMRNWLRL